MVDDLLLQAVVAGAVAGATAAGVLLLAVWWLLRGVKTSLDGFPSRDDGGRQREAVPDEAG